MSFDCFPFDLIASSRIPMNAHDLEQCQAIIQVLGSDVVVGQDISCAGSTVAIHQLDINSVAYPLVVGRTPNPLEGARMAIARTS